MCTPTPEPQSWRVTSCTRDWASLILCLITAEIMRVQKGFVLPLRTPSAADRAAGIFSCCPCWLADRRAHTGSGKSQTAGSFVFPNIDRYSSDVDELPLMTVFLLSVCFFFTFIVCYNAVAVRKWLHGTFVSRRVSGCRVRVDSGSNYLLTGLSLRFSPPVWFMRWHSVS